jgi:hypothetical protein
MAAFGGNESCPNCGARMAVDQRYCLNCGHRRGEPRLPFMDAVVFMESMSAPGGAAGTPPPPPPEQKSNRMNANAALIAGVATLVLAIGVGFLIGRSGHEDSGGSQAAAPIKVIEVPGGGGGGETAAASTPEETTGAAEKAGEAKGKSGGKSANKAAAKTKASDVKEGSQQEEERAKAKTNEVLHTSGEVELETEVEVGGKCKQGAAGCSESGEFTGNFFGE